MVTLISPTTQPIILEGVGWATYTCLLTDFGDSHAARLAYDQGTLEIMAPSFAHERLKSLLTELIVALATGMDLDFESAGSTTFAREDVGRGFEPDASFYVQHVADIQGRTTIDLTTDPPPDLVVEVDITHPSLNKLPLDAAIGVPEVWRYDGQRVLLYRRVNDTYEPAEVSMVLRGVTRQDVAHLLTLSHQMPRAAWIRHVQAWPHTQGLDTPGAP
jgi:Uma2 family endonuclease